MPGTSQDPGSGVGALAHSGGCLLLPFPLLSPGQAAPGLPSAPSPDRVPQTGAQQEAVTERWLGSLQSPSCLSASQERGLGSWVVHLF